LDVNVNGVDLGAQAIESVYGITTPQGQAFTPNRTLTFVVTGLVAVDSLHIIGSPGGVYVSDVQVDGVDLGSSLQPIGPGAWAISAGAWNNALALNLGSASDPIQVTGTGSNDVAYVLGSANEYTFTGIGTSTIHLSESAGLEQNAVLTNTAFINFQDGTVLNTLTGNAMILAGGAGALPAYISAVTVADTAADVSANLDGLAALASTGKLSSITLTDSGVPMLAITSGQLTSDVGALKAITDGFSLDVSPSSSTASISGLVGHINTVVLTGSIEQYAISNTGSVITVTDSVASRDGTDTLNNVQQVKFSDITLVFDPHSSQDLLVYELYQAAYDRTPDNGGFRYWAAFADTTGASALILADQFLAAAEFTQKYGANPSNTTYVTELYTNVLGRAPDPSGLAYWIGEANAGLPRDQLLVSFATSAENVHLVGAHTTNGYWTT
jgi:hypothetical protein